jgi:hypothetical protein
MRIESGNLPGIAGVSTSPRDGKTTPKPHVHPHGDDTVAVGSMASYVAAALQVAGVRAYDRSYEADPAAIAHALVERAFER